MRTRRTKQNWLGWPLPVVLALFAAALLTCNRQAVAQAFRPDGIICTSAASPNPSFSLTTQTGYVQLPDGNTMFMWGYSEAGKSFQHPGPVLCVNQGDTVTIHLQNTLNEDASIVFPGQEGVLAGGAPAQPQFDVTTPTKLTSLTNVAPKNGGSVTYSFVASNPGTFIYQSGTAPEKQVRMGLFGALIVRPTRGANFAYDRADTQFLPAEEFMVLLSEIDPYQHEAAEAGRPFNMTNYHARYWLVNGRGFPDTIAQNSASWLPTQPYGALALIHPYDTSRPPGLVRYLNVGTEEFPFHPHGNNGLVIGRDGRALEGLPGSPIPGADLSFEKFAVNIGPGQTWDLLFKWHDAEGYSPANPLPITVPDIANLSFGMFYSASPYLGVIGSYPPGMKNLNQCGEFYIISHNHALYQITAWGVNMAGPITYVRVDPPMPNSCPPR